MVAAFFATLALACAAAFLLVSRRAQKAEAERALTISNAQSLAQSVDAFLADLDKVAKPHCCATCGRVKSLRPRAEKKLRAVK